MIMEVVRGFVSGYYLDILDRPLPIANGVARIEFGHGLGAKLNPRFLARSDLLRRRSQRADVGAARSRTSTRASLAVTVFHRLAPGFPASRAGGSHAGSELIAAAFRMIWRWSGCGLASVQRVEAPTAHESGSESGEGHLASTSAPERSARGWR